jgi:hypothetical protein
MIDELALVNDAVLTDFERTARLRVAVLNRPELVHFAAVLGSTDTTMKRLLRAVESPLAARQFPLSGIWRSYTAALVNLHRAISTHIPLPKAKGHEKYYIPYVSYMTATNAEEKEAAGVAVAQSFADRHRDRQFIDWLGLDGDSEKPVRWDFRLHAIDASRTKRYT